MDIDKPCKVLQFNEAENGDIHITGRREFEVIALLGRELRSSLSAIRNAVRALRRAPDVATRERLQNFLERQTNLMSNLLEELLLSHGGLGLGLALVRRIVELHGGTVDAQRDGSGTASEFVVRLRREPGVETECSEADGERT